MRLTVFFPLWVCTLLAVGQGNIHLGLNASPLIINTIDLQTELQISSNFALQIGLGGRYQNRKEPDPAGSGFLSEYVAARNHGAFLSVGGRIFNFSEWDYPYFALDVVGSYFNEEILLPNSPAPNPQTRKVQGLKLGVAATMGFMIRLSDRYYLDLGMKMGYSPPRPKEDVLAYYLTGMGFSTFGLGRLGVDGGHFQPVVTLKYNLIKGKRQRILEME